MCLDGEALRIYCCTTGMKKCSGGGHRIGTSQAIQRTPRSRWACSYNRHVITFSHDDTEHHHQLSVCHGARQCTRAQVPNAPPCFHACAHQRPLVMCSQMISTTSRGSAEMRDDEYDASMSATISSFTARGKYLNPCTENCCGNGCTLS